VLSPCVGLCIGICICILMHSMCICGCVVVVGVESGLGVEVAVSGILCLGAGTLELVCIW